MKYFSVTYIWKCASNILCSQFNWKSTKYYNSVYIYIYIVYIKQVVWKVPGLALKMWRVKANNAIGFRRWNRLNQIEWLASPETFQTTRYPKEQFYKYINQYKKSMCRYLRDWTEPKAWKWRTHRHTNTHTCQYSFSVCCSINAYVIYTHTYIYIHIFIDLVAKL